MKKSILIISILLTVLNLNAQHKLYFAQDIISKYGKKTRVFRTDTLDFAACEAVIKTDSFSLKIGNEFEAFNIQYYIRNNTDAPIRLTCFSTSSGSNLPKYDEKHNILKPSEIGCYIIQQGYLSLGPRASSGYLNWEYIDKHDKQKKVKNIGLPYRWRIFE
jgi:hypothetical protein